MGKIDPIAHPKIFQAGRLGYLWVEIRALWKIPNLRKQDTPFWVETFWRSNRSKTKRLHWSHRHTDWERNFP